MQKQTVIVAIVALIIGAGVGYVAAPKSSAATRPGGNFAAHGNFTGGSFARGSQNGNSFLSGTVVKATSSSLTLNTRDGSSHVVILTPDTTVSKSVTGSVSDLTAGANVIVNGTTGNSGSVTASLVQIRPAGAPNAPAGK